jgi:hypothetical protein
MANPRLRRWLEHTALVLSLSACFAACSGSTDGGSDGGHSGGSTGSGGSGAGGAIGTGGNLGSGGKAGLGGSMGAGGMTGLGGVVGSGGSVISGGALGTGGSPGPGGATGSGGSGGGEYGFTYRPVQTEQLDWLCTLHAVGQSTYVYVRLDQTGTKSAGIATVPVYTAKLARISASGTVTDLASAQYDFGGGHNNDSLQVDYQGKTYKYYHSSFGFGWRQCQPMDCINIYALDSTTLENEGCATTRSLPEFCVPIKADGTHDPLVDTFKKCAGDASK